MPRQAAEANVETSTNSVDSVEVRAIIDDRKRNRADERSARTHGHAGLLIIADRPHARSHRHDLSPSLRLHYLRGDRPTDLIRFSAHDVSNRSVRTARTFPHPQKRYGCDDSVHDFATIQAQTAVGLRQNLRRAHRRYRVSSLVGALITVKERVPPTKNASDREENDTTLNRHLFRYDVS